MNLNTLRLYVHVQPFGIQSEVRLYTSYAASISCLVSIHSLIGCLFNLDSLSRCLSLPNSPSDPTGSPFSLSLSQADASYDHREETDESQSWTLIERVL